MQKTRTDPHTSPFEPLPRALNTNGAERRIGVEIEFAGLREAQVADIVRARFGGRVTSAARKRTLTDTSIGKLEVSLDTAFRDAQDSDVTDALLEIGRAVVPLEIVTEPLEPAALARLDPLIDDLRAAGARGTGEGVLLGFGLHLNVEVQAETVGAIVPTVRAFALLEDWLRKSNPIDLARRILPFVDPYPRRLVDRLVAEGPGWSVTDFIDAYLAESPSRNRALDLLPLLRHLDEHRVSARLPKAAAIKARPAYHYRLPDCRIDEAAWSLAWEWNRWCFVERVAGNTDLMAALADAWQEHRAALTTLRSDWPETVGSILSARGVGTAMA